ncbi:hypothetical protein GGI05_005799, partial [Coemansia sp. RSA 2603]
MSTTTSEFDTKREQGLKHKDAGNELFKKGEFQEGNDVMSTVVPKDPDNLEESDVTELNKDLSVIQTNMAACHVRLNRPTRAVQCAEDALKSNPFNKKAKFRLVQGYIREGSLLKAGKLLDELEKDSPDDAAFAAERRNIAAKEAEAEKKQ